MNEILGMEKALEIVSNMGYEAEKSGLNYIIGRKKESKEIQWFRLDNDRLLKRKDFSLNSFSWIPVDI